MVPRTPRESLFELFTISKKGGKKYSRWKARHVPLHVLRAYQGSLILHLPPTPLSQFLSLPNFWYFWMYMFFVKIRAIVHWQWVTRKVRLIGMEETCLAVFFSLFHANHLFFLMLMNVPPPLESSGTKDSNWEGESQVTLLAKVTFIIFGWKEREKERKRERERKRKKERKKNSGYRCFSSPSFFLSFSFSFFLSFLLSLFLSFFLVPWLLHLFSSSPFWMAHFTCLTSRKKHKKGFLLPNIFMSELHFLSFLPSHYFFCYKSSSTFVSVWLYVTYSMFEWLLSNFK